MIQNLAQFTDVRAALVVGGLSSQLQASTLRSNPEVVVATPVSTLQSSRRPQRGIHAALRLKDLAPGPWAPFGSSLVYGSPFNSCRHCRNLSADSGMFCEVLLPLQGATGTGMPRSP